MATYYVPENVRSEGRKVHKGDFVHKHLVAVMGNGLREMAVDVTKEDEYAHFYAQYATGWWFTFELYDY